MEHDKSDQMIYKSLFEIMKNSPKEEELEAKMYWESSMEFKYNQEILQEEKLSVKNFIIESIYQNPGN